ncbi:MAG TPA: 2-dehydropantoate 2-reductase [Planctomycetes bacterium]|nr:2-dehydropantoate 2-reductase [Planctomycetota bacterium]
MANPEKFASRDDDPQDLIAVVGAGALGRWLAARLQACGQAVRLVTRPGSMTRTLKCHVTGAGTTLDQEVESMPAENCEPGKIQWLLYCTKAGDLKEAARETASLLSPGGWSAVLSNGLGHADTLAEMGINRCLAATVTYGLCPVEGGAVEQRGAGGQVTVGPIAPGFDIEKAFEASRWLAGRFRSAGLKSEAVEDGAELVWRKATLNAGLNPVAALIRRENGEVPGHPLFPLAIEASREVIQVAREVGVDLSKDDPEQLLRDLCRDTSTNRCSTLQDLEARRPTEMEWICGAVVRIAESAGIEVPANRLLAKMVQEAESSCVAV